jgi:hypothetical protein
MNSHSIALMKSIDTAWNNRDWEQYAALLSDQFQGWTGSSQMPHDKPSHVLNAKTFCEAVPDALVHTDPYLQLFANPDGSRTCSVARLTGEITGRLEAASHNALLRVGRIDLTFSCVCLWSGGQIIRQWEHVDSRLLL